MQSAILAKLATSLNRRDEVPNRELAKSVAKKKDKAAVKELLENLTNKNQDIANDCIKTLYEIGYIEPALLVPHAKAFIDLLGTKNNRMQWGIMTALAEIAKADPKTVYAALAKIIAVAEKGSVITNDQYVNILLRLAESKTYNDKAMPLLLEQLKRSPTNQLPKYAEDSMKLVPPKYKSAFVKALQSRLVEIEKDTKRKRVEKVIQKAMK
jgi:hypothetical protein